MKLKKVEGLHIYQTVDGRIAISQDSFEYGKRVDVFLTLEQFNSLESWVFKNKDEIEADWNGGVEDEPKA